MASLSIIIPHLNDAQRLRRCLSALAPQVSGDVEVVVVDNGSDTPIDEIMLEFKWAQLVFEPTPGAGHARNAGVTSSTAPVLAFLDCDCVPAADWVARIKELSVTNRVIGGRIKTFDEGNGKPNPAQLFERLFAFDNARYVKELGFSATANLLTSRAVFEAAGPFRGGVPEDLEWCMRARVAGAAVVYAPDLTVWHPTRADWVELARKYHRLALEGYGLRRQGDAGWAMRAVLTGLSPLRDTARVLFSPRLSGPWQRVQCLSVLYRLRLARMTWMLRLLRIRPDRPARLSPDRHL